MAQTQRQLSLSDPMHKRDEPAISLSVPKKDDLYLSHILQKTQELVAADKEGGKAAMLHALAKEQEVKKAEKLIDPAQALEEKQREEKQRRQFIQKELDEIRAMEVVTRERKRLEKKEELRKFEEKWKAVGELIWAALHGKKPDPQIQVTTKAQASNIMDQQERVINNTHQEMDERKSQIAGLFAGGELEKAATGLYKMRMTHEKLPAHSGNLAAPDTPAEHRHIQVSAGRTASTAA